MQWSPCEGCGREYPRLSVTRISLTVTADSCFVVSEAVKLLGKFIMKRIKNYEQKLGLKVNIYIGPLPWPSKGSVQVRDTEA